MNDNVEEHDSNEFGIDTNSDTFKKLFDSIDNDNIRVERVKFILNVYGKWIEMKQTNGVGYGVDIYDIINSLLSPNYKFINFLMDYNYVSNNKHLLPYIDDVKNVDDDVCDIHKCFVMDRHERPKEYYTIHQNKRNKLFFGKHEDNKQDDDALTKSIAT
eukprot:474095_1